MRTLPHPVPQSTGSPSAMVPGRIRNRVKWTCCSNLDVFGMLPSIRSADRRFASLHWVLQGGSPAPTVLSKHYYTGAIWMVHT